MVYKENDIKNVFIFDFISGMSVGIEFYFGEALEPEDTFAMSIDFFIELC